MVVVAEKSNFYIHNFDYIFSSKRLLNSLIILFKLNSLKNRSSLLYLSFKTESKFLCIIDIGTLVLSTICFKTYHSSYK